MPPYDSSKCCLIITRSKLMKTITMRACKILQAELMLEILQHGPISCTKPSDAMAFLFSAVVHESSSTNAMERSLKDIRVSRHEYGSTLHASKALEVSKDSLDTSGTLRGEKAINKNCFMDEVATGVNLSSKSLHVCSPMPCMMHLKFNFEGIM
ncbi:hypothetical protein GOBAR_AA08936 [Gossypium barbadense]|uniref:Uncharacterized protein n=1 Tax=Gossypium barbadense TaxID=3634 RepID=A0A2P5Y7W4_GOSBA|nr:hypothetical protein GOBAR_AA08936 [Gossypium barbadense]